MGRIVAMRAVIGPSVSLIAHFSSTDLDGYQGESPADKQRTLEKMTQHTPVFAGMDISKLHLDVYLEPLELTKRFSNDRTGWRRLVDWLRRHDVGGVVYEATGCYHKEVERFLAGHGFPIHRLNPKRARRFAEALGTNAKTDQVDARMLARYGALLKPKGTDLPSLQIDRIKELVAARRSLIKQKTRIANKSLIVTIPLLKRQLQQAGKQVRKQIKAIDDACRTLILADPEMLRRYDILMSIPAIGNVTANTLIADMPELGNLSDKQVASLVGVAPVARDSGTFRGKRHIRGGRAQVRQALYMTAMVSMRFNADMKKKYDAMTAKGKLPKVVLTAIIRKLVILANALIRDNREWTEKAPCI